MLAAGTFFLHVRHTFAPNGQGWDFRQAQWAEHARDGAVFFALARADAP